MSYEVPQVRPFLGEEEVDNLREVIETAWVSEGPYSAEFREQIKNVTGSEYAVLAPNGTLSLYMGLLALGVGEGDEVIVPDFTYCSSATSVVYAGAKPVFADVDPDTFQVDVDDVAANISTDTAAIMPVHVYGQAAEMDALVDIAERNDVAI
ncbi:MAG: DegT/DnrJ/EryC1/StrS family aminotransferase, partial [Halorhabdus sp.]